METYMFRTISLSIISSPALYTQQNLYDIYLLQYVQCWTPDDGQRDCPKHVAYYSKNKFEKLVHLVGFVTRIYHDARSSECQIRAIVSRVKLGPTGCLHHANTKGENFIIKRVSLIAVLSCKSESPCFDPSWCQWTFH